MPDCVFCRLLAGEIPASFVYRDARCAAFAAAMQEVFHVHSHVFPRFRGDGFGLRFGPHYAELPPRGVLDETAVRIREALDSPDGPGAGLSGSG